MQNLYIAIDAVDSLLRRNVKKGSWLWYGLSKVRNLFVSFRYNPISKYKWESNSRRFDRIIEKYSIETHNFFVLQIGACDGVMDDPIYKWIKKYRWQGILVEPQKKEFERLKITYRENDNLILENAAIADNNELRSLYKVKDEKIEADWQRGLASLTKNSILVKQDMVATEIVQCTTFDTLMNRHQVKQIDLLQIDAEGYDYDLLKLFDFDKIKPRLIRYEHRFQKLHDKSSLQLYLTQKGYSILEMEKDTGAVLRQC